MPAPDIDAKVLCHLAELVQLDIDPSETDLLARDLSRLLDYVDGLPTLEGAQANAPALSEQPERADQVLSTDCASDVVAAAPVVERTYFSVPKTVDS